MINRHVHAHTVHVHIHARTLGPCTDTHHYITNWKLKHNKACLCDAYNMYSRPSHSSDSQSSDNGFADMQGSTVGTKLNLPNIIFFY